jgi:hypothetical protein
MIGPKLAFHPGAHGASPQMLFHERSSRVVEDRSFENVQLNAMLAEVFHLFRKSDIVALSVYRTIIPTRREFKGSSVDPSGLLTGLL